MATSTLTVNLAMYTGEDKTIDCIVFASDLATPRDITGWAMEFVVHALDDPTTVFITKVTPSQVVITNGPQGTVSIILAAADTVNIRASQQYEFFFARTDPGEACVVTHGLFSLLRR